MRSPIALEQFADSAQPAQSCMLFPSEAYRSAEFSEFELASVWRKEWVAVGRAEEIAKPGDYFTVTIGREPILVVRANNSDINAFSPICRHRGTIFAEGTGNCGGTFVCPYHGWSYDMQGNLRAAPQMAGRAGFDKSRHGLPRLRVELWQGIIFINFAADAARLAPRLQPLERYVGDWRLGDLRGEFLRDPNYKMHFDYAWNWKVYAEGQSECYHCDKLHGATPAMRNFDFGSMSMEVDDAEAGIWAFSLRAKEKDPTVNQYGRAILPPIPTLSDEQRYLAYSITIAPNVFIELMADSVIMLNWLPTGPQSMRVKRHRLYPESTLAATDFDELHRSESPAIREFVGQDDFAFERVQAGLNSIFAPRGPVAPNEPILVGFNHWLIERYRRADRAADGARKGGAA